MLRSLFFGDKGPELVPVIGTFMKSLMTSQRLARSKLKETTYINSQYEPQTLEDIFKSAAPQPSRKWLLLSRMATFKQASQTLNGLFFELSCRDSPT